MFRLTLTQKLQQRLMMEQAVDSWKLANSYAKQLIKDTGLELSPDQEASLTTHVSMAAPIWKIQQQKWNPKDYEHPVFGRLRHPLEPLALRSFMLNRMEDMDGPGPTQKHVYAALGAMFSDDKDRHTFLEFIFGDPSSKKLTPQQRWILVKWMGYWESSGYHVSPVAIVEAEAVLEYARLGRDEEADDV